jgi:hypothetical protein
MSELHDLIIPGFLIFTSEAVQMSLSVLDFPSEGLEEIRAVAQANQLSVEE